MFNDKLKKWIEDGASPGYIIFYVIFCWIFPIMFVYVIFNDYITSVWYEMGIINGGDAGLFDLFVDYWQIWFIIAMTFSILLWMLVNANPEAQQ